MPTTQSNTGAKKKRREFDPDDVRMTLGEHLEELRGRLIRLLIGLGVGAVVCFVFRARLMQLLLGPTFAVLARRGLTPQIYSLDPVEPFITTLRTSLIMGFIVSAPYGIYQIWAFVAAGLYPREQRFVRRFVPVSIVLFMTGAVFFLLVVLPVLLHFLIGFMETVPSFDPGGFFFGDRLVVSRPAPAPTTTQPIESPIPVLGKNPAGVPSGYAWIDAKTRELKIQIGDDVYVIPTQRAATQNTIRPNFSMRYTIDFTLRLAASFGLGFQVPVVVAFLATVGICTSAQMSKSRRMTWFIMAAAAAVFTPPDVSSMLLLMVPMALLFEAGLVAARIIERRREAARAAEGL